MATLDGTDLGKLQNESTKMDSGVVPMPLPDSNSNETQLMPITGPVAYISIRGKKGGSYADAQAFIQQLSDWVAKGGKVSEDNLDFVGDLYTTSRSIRVIRSDWSASAEEPNMVYYTIEMVEGVFL